MKGRIIPALLLGALVFAGCKMEPEGNEAEISFKNDLDVTIDIRLMDTGKTKNNPEFRAIPAGTVTETRAIEARSYDVFWRASGEADWEKITTFSYRNGEKRQHIVSKSTVMIQ
jgi:hypothetical protein